MIFNNSILKEKASNDVMKCGLRYLGLKDETTEMLRKVKVRSSATLAYKFVTVEDVITIDIDSLRNLLYKYLPYQQVDHHLIDLQECLAKLGVKIKNSDFDSFDVSVERLELEKAIKRKLEKSTMIKTIGDLKNYGSNKLKKLLNLGYNEIERIFDEMEKYGVKLEGSTRKLNSENKFPLTKKAHYFVIEKSELENDNSQKVSSTNHRKPTIVHKIIANEPKKDIDFSKIIASSAKPATERPEENIKVKPILSLPVSTLKLKPKTLYFITNKLPDIKTIGDLLEIKKSVLKSRLNNNFIMLVDIEDALAEHGYLLKGSKMVIINGRAVGKKYVTQAKIQKDLANAAASNTIESEQPDEQQPEGGNS